MTENFKEPHEHILRSLIRDVPDFPEPGILFKDITPLLANAEGFHTAIVSMANSVVFAPYIINFDCIAAVEARGFIFAAPLARLLNLPFVPLRKPNKLPYDTHSHQYDLEYGTDTLEIHTDALLKNSKVLLVDDVLATGGTATAAHNLVKKAGGHISAVSVLIELTSLGGRERLLDKANQKNTFSILKY